MAGVPVDIIARAPRAGGGHRRQSRCLTSCSARARPTARAGSASRRPAPRRRASTRSTPWPDRRPGLRLRLREAQARRRAARGRDPPPARAGHPRPAGRRQRSAGRRGRGRAQRSLSCVFRRPESAISTASASAAATSGLARPRGSAPGRRPSRTDAAGPVRLRRHRPRPLRLACPSATPASPSRDSISMPTIATPPRRSRWPSSRRGSSRAASWPPTPASRSRGP